MSESRTALATLSVALYAGFLSRLGQEPAKEGGFQRWLLRGSYQPMECQDRHAVLLSRAKLSEFVPYACYDFERFSLSSRETFAVFRDEYLSKRISSWPLLKLYYSAFFAAHALMRGRGMGVVKLARQHTGHLNAVGSTFLKNHDPMLPGMFKYAVLRSRVLGEIEVTIEPAPTGAGVHESFWTMFCEFLNAEAALSVKNGMADSAEFVVGAAEITQAIRAGGHGSGAWLSSIRNEINYQHMHETWFPLRKGSAAISALDRSPPTESSLVRLDHSKTRDTIKMFMNVSYFLALLNVEVGDLVAGRSTRGQAFGQKWRKLGNLMVQGV